MELPPGSMTLRARLGQCRSPCNETLGLGVLNRNCPPLSVQKLNFSANCPTLGLTEVLLMTPKVAELKLLSGSANWMIEHIEKLSAKLQAAAFPQPAHWSGPSKREVEVRLGWSVDDSRSTVSKSGSHAICANNRWRCETRMVEVVVQLRLHCTRCTLYQEFPAASTSCKAVGDIPRRGTRSSTFSSVFFQCDLGSD